MNTKPILVMMSYRGGDRLKRCLRSIAESEQHFSRIVVSVTSASDSDDMKQCLAFQENVLPRAEVICTGVELPTMQHQSYWVSYLEASGTTPTDWIFWLAYDDEVRHRGISQLLDQDNNWPVENNTVYMGPWAMRHEGPTTLFEGSEYESLESWTCFPQSGPLKLPVLSWITDQIRQPTYIQMSGSVAQFSSYLDLRDGKPSKRGPMRIEMAIASTRKNLMVGEFATPVSIIYGRSNSDRANYARTARREDIHLVFWTARYAKWHPLEFGRFVLLVLHSLTSMLSSLFRKQGINPEEWRVRGQISP